MIQPTRNNVVVKLDPVIASAGQFIIKPDISHWRGKEGAIEGENRGTVILVGPGELTKRGHRLEMSIKKGDVVRFSELEYHAWKENGDTYCLISEKDVLFVEEEQHAA